MKQAAIVMVNSNAKCHNNQDPETLSRLRLNDTGGVITTVKGMICRLI